MLKNNQSKLPSSVNILKAKPRVSRTVSAESARPATVENRQNRSVFFPTLLRKAAEVTSEISSVTSKYPWALVPLAWTRLERFESVDLEIGRKTWKHWELEMNQGTNSSYRSGMRSCVRCWINSKRLISWSKRVALSWLPILWVAAGFNTGAPFIVVIAGSCITPLFYALSLVLHSINGNI